MKTLGKDSALIGYETGSYCKEMILSEHSGDGGDTFIQHNRVPARNFYRSFSIV